MSEGGPNSGAGIRARVDAGILGWGWPVAMTFARLVLIALGLATAYAIYAATGEDEPFLASLLTASLVTVVVNIVSLLLLRWLTSREGIRLRDLIGFDRSRLWPDIGWGLVLLVILNVPFIATIVLAGVLLGGGGDFAMAMENVFAGALADPNVTPGVPIWVPVAPAVLFPLVNPVVEEMHYRGYVQPRLEALGGSSGLAIVVMAIGFALQHLAYAYSVSGMMAYVAAFFVWGVGAGIVYARMRRLTSLIVAHFVINASTAVVPVVFLLLGST